MEEELASVEPDQRPATLSEERNWWLAIISVLAATLLVVWLLGQLA